MQISYGWVLRQVFVQLLWRIVQLRWNVHVFLEPAEIRFLGVRGSLRHDSSVCCLGDRSRTARKSPRLNSNPTHSCARMRASSDHLAVSRSEDAHAPASDLCSGDASRNGLRVAVARSLLRSLAVKPVLVGLPAARCTATVMRIPTLACCCACTVDWALLDAGALTSWRRWLMSTGAAPQWYGPQLRCAGRGARYLTGRAAQRAHAR